MAQKLAKKPTQDATGRPGVEQHGVGTKSRHATIAIRKRVNPDKATVRRARATSAGTKSHLAEGDL